MKKTPLEHAPYMGIITIEHHVSDSPLDFVGETLPDNSMVHISLYAAAYDPEHRKPVKQGLLSQHRMTQNQFAELVARPNYNEGSVATLTHLDKHRVNPLPEKPASELERATEKALKDDEQIVRFLREAKHDTQTLIEKGRANKGTLAQIAHILATGANNLACNKRHRIKCFQEALQRRSVRAFQSLQDTINSVLTTQQAPKALPNGALECGDIDAPVMFQISTSVSSGGGLFCADQNHNMVGLTLSSARPSTTMEGYTSDASLWRAHMSCLDYARMLRTDGTAIPVTLIRFGGKGVGEVDPEHYGLHRASANGIEHEGIQALALAFSALAARVNNNEFKNKAALKSLLSEIESLEADYQATLTDYLPKVESALGEMVDAERNTLHSLLEQSVRQLPEHKQREAAQKSQPLLRRLMDKR